MRIHGDDRRLFFGDLFSTESGDVNIVVLLPGATCAWHRHKEQDDRLFCVQGTVKVGITTGPTDTVTWEVLSDRDPRIVTIERGLWHGYMNIGPDRAILVGYNNRKYDGTDEERMTVFAMGHEWQPVPR